MKISAAKQLELPREDFFKPLKKFVNLLDEADKKKPASNDGEVLWQLHAEDDSTKASKVQLPSGFISLLSKLLKMFEHIKKGDWLQVSHERESTGQPVAVIENYDDLADDLILNSGIKIPQDLFNRVTDSLSSLFENPIRWDNVSLPDAQAKINHHGLNYILDIFRSAQRIYKVLEKSDENGVVKAALKALPDLDTATSIAQLAQKRPVRKEQYTFDYATEYPLREGEDCNEVYYLLNALEFAETLNSFAGEITDLQYK